MGKRNGFFEAALAGLFLMGSVGMAYADLLAPTGVTATPLSGSEIQISWVDTNASESAYVVERSNFASGPFVAIGKAPLGLRDTGLTRATTYFYRVYAVRPIRRTAPTRL